MTDIYHITHVDNLPGILREEALLCDREVASRGLCSQSIAYDAIKERRARREVETLAGVPVAAGGTLYDYVPFYFTNRSPMLYVIHQGHVPAYQAGQKEVIYLVSSIELAEEAGCAWCFTDGHAVEGVTEFYDSLANLNQVDWKTVESWRWGGRWLRLDSDIKRRKQAEFLVHRRFPWELVKSVAVIDEKMRTRVGELLAAAGQSMPVTIERKWYYD